MGGSGAAASISSVTAPVATAAAAGGGAAVRRGEYLGPDGDLAANLERDVLDRSPGIRCVTQTPRLKASRQCIVAAASMTPMTPQWHPFH